MFKIKGRWSCTVIFVHLHVPACQHSCIHMISIAYLILLYFRKLRNKNAMPVLVREKHKKREKEMRDLCLTVFLSYFRLLT